MSPPIVSIIIATFNSEKTLPKVLDSIHNQTLSKDKLEIIVVDGGSNDRTIEIASKFGCKILKNPGAIPFISKLLGTSRAKGKYIVYLDSDEEILNRRSLQLKYEVFQKNNRIKAVVGSGYKDPAGSSFIRSYINEFGDPFSFFIYRVSKNYKFFLKQMFKRYPIIGSHKNYVLFDYYSAKELPIIELGAAASMVKLEYIRKKFRDFNYETFAHLFYLMILDKGLVAITKNDVLIHHSSDGFKPYLNKIRWRVKNNIYFKVEMGPAGFSGREKYLSSWGRLKKYLFIPYSFSVLFPLIDAIYLGLTRKRIGYLLHLPLTLYTAFLILYHHTLKVIGIKQFLRSYDESKVVGN